MRNFSAHVLRRMHSARHLSGTIGGTASLGGAAALSQLRGEVRSAQQPGKRVYRPIYTCMVQSAFSRRGKEECGKKRQRNRFAGKRFLFLHRSPSGWRKAPKGRKLSYFCRIFDLNAKGRKTKNPETITVSGFFMVDANGLEPLTPCTSSRCSSQLS